MQSTGHSSMHALSLTSTQGSAITYVTAVLFQVGSGSSVADVPVDGPSGAGRDVRYTRDAGPGDTGVRVSLRRRLDEGGLGDVLGVVEHWGDGEVRVRDRHGVLHVVA